MFTCVRLHVLSHPCWMRLRTRGDAELICDSKNKNPSVITGMFLVFTSLFISLHHLMNRCTENVKNHQAHLLNFSFSYNNVTKEKRGLLE